MKPKLVFLSALVTAIAVWGVAGASASSNLNYYTCVDKKGGVTVVSIGTSPPTNWAKACKGKTQVWWKQISGIDGVKGTTGVTGSGGFQGDKGPVGDQGPASSTTGDKGPTGTLGPLGDPGQTGPQGDPGGKGNTGAKGPTGDTGNTGTTGPSVPVVVTNSDVQTALAVGPGNEVAENATCAPGYRLLGGGVWTDDNGTSSIPVLLESHRVSNSETWTAAFYNAGTTSGDVSWTVYALCSQQPQ